MKTYNQDTCTFYLLYLWPLWYLKEKTIILDNIGLYRSKEVKTQSNIDKVKKGKRKELHDIVNFNTNNINFLYYCQYICLRIFILTYQSKHFGYYDISYKQEVMNTDAFIPIVATNILVLPYYYHL